MLDYHYLKYLHNESKKRLYLYVTKEDYIEWYPGFILVSYPINSYHCGNQITDTRCEIMRDAPNALKYINVYPPYNARLECTSILHYTEIQPGVSDGNTEYRHGLCG